MPDRLVDMYKIWLEKFDNGQDPNLYQAFQGGVTAGAVSMRERAMRVIDEITPRNMADLNSIKNAIGSLSDIPGSE